MADFKNSARAVLSIVLVGATILGAVNVFSDNKDIKALGEEAACGKAGCSVTLTRESRNPIKQSFTFQVSTSPVKTVNVDCERQYLLLGDYGCAVAP